jgi:hypothetical protein
MIRKPFLSVLGSMLIPCLLLLLLDAAHADSVNCWLERVGNEFQYVCDETSNHPEDRDTSPSLNRSPTTAPGDLAGEKTSVIVDNSLLPALEYVDESPQGQRLRNCQGDCNTDDQCAYGLSCFKRNGSGPVPGCSGEGISMLDYCFYPPPGTLVLMGDTVDSYLVYPLSKCQGHCHSDADCAGDLRCWKRTIYEPIPGCEGDGARDNNYCYDTEDLPSAQPSRSPSSNPSSQPSLLQSDMPSSLPSVIVPINTSPSLLPSFMYSALQSIVPSATSSGILTSSSLSPSAQPTPQLSPTPSASPSSSMSDQPSLEPTSLLIMPPSSFPSVQPTLQSTFSQNASPFPSDQPSMQPTSILSAQTSNVPSDQP